MGILASRGLQVLVKFVSPAIATFFGINVGADGMTATSWALLAGTLASKAFDIWSHGKQAQAAQNAPATDKEEKTSGK